MSIDCLQVSPTRKEYETLLPAMMALTTLQPVNVHVPGAVITAFGVAPRIAVFRPQILDQIPGLDLVRFDGIEQRGRALLYAEAVYRTKNASADGLSALAEKAVVVRERLHTVLQMLLVYKVIPAETLKACSWGNGYEPVGTDVQTLAVTLSRNWEAIQSRCPVQLSELQEAEALALQILRLVGVREHETVEAGIESEMRSRAFTLFWEAYEEARRAVNYLRWEQDDADDFAPSLYAGRGHKKSGSKTEDQADETEETGSGSASGKSNVAGSPSATSTAPIPVGYPGSNPFIR